MAKTVTEEAALGLIHEGWNHLMSQRPLAAWGSWQRAARLDPNSVAVREALATLESATDLPLAARKTYRFRRPRTESQRLQWNQVFGNARTTELEDAAAAFDHLVRLSGSDADARFNLALCQAWLGRDLDAIDNLAAVVELEAENRFEYAVEAWTLAEILRQGGGAETLADDLRFACTYSWNAADTPELLAHYPEIRRIPTPVDPICTERIPSEIELFEWLEHPFPGILEAYAPKVYPRVLATLYITPGSLRLSSPVGETLEIAEERLQRLLGDRLRPLDRVATPLPLPFKDADVWLLRFPEGLDPAGIQRALREGVETYYENQWIHRPRRALQGRSPLATASLAHHGDRVARAMLEAVVRIREQLGERRSLERNYQGYPFDRLRRRLGLELNRAATVDDQDLSCASPWELEALRPEALDVHRLKEAFESAAGLRDDSLSIRFARPLAELEAFPPGLDPTSFLAPIVRQEMDRNQPDQAIAHIDRLLSRVGEPARSTLTTWKAEILARVRRPEEAATIYRAIVESSASALVALDAAETLLDRGYPAYARRFLEQAERLAHDSGLAWIERRARYELERLPP